MTFNTLYRLFGRLADFIYSRKVIVFWVCIGVTVILFFPARNLKLDSDLSSLLSEKHPVVVNLRKIAKYYGGEGSLIVLLRAPSAQAGEGFIQELVPDLNSNANVRFVDFKKPTEFLEQHMMLFIDEADLETIHSRLKKKLDYEREKKGAANSLLDLDETPDPGFQLDDIISKYKKKYNVSDKDKGKTDSIYFHKKEMVNGRELHSYVLLIKPAQSSTDVEFSKKLIAEVDKLIKKHEPAKKQIQYHFTGRYQKKIDLLEQLGKDFSLVSLISAGGILLILIVFYRSFWPVVLVFTALIVGLIWTLGVTQIFFAKLNLVTSFLVAILTGLGIDFGIHFMTRLHEELEAGKTVKEGIYLMISQTGLSSAISGFTTAFAFFILVLSEFRAFAEFGMIAGIGITLILLAMTFLLGSMMVMVNQRFPMKFSKKRNPLSLPAGFFRRPGLLLVVFSVLTVVFLGGIRILKFDYNFDKIFSYPDLESFKLDVEVNKMFNATLTPSIVIAESVEEERKIIKAVRDHIHSGIKGNLIENVMGLSTFVPENQPEKMRVIRKLQSLTDRFSKYVPLLKPEYRDNYIRFQKALKVKPFTTEDLPPIITNNFQGLNQYKDKRIILVFPDPIYDTGDNAIRFGRQVNQIFIDGKPIAMASDTLIFAEILTIITDGGYKILGYCFLGVFLLILLNLSSLKKSLIVITPLIISMIWMSGAMGLFGLPVDFFNVIIFPIIIGIGIDSSVHIYNRYQEEGDMLKSVLFTGEAISLSSLTTLVGFGALSVARSAGVRSIGYLAIIGVVTAYLTSVLILPSLVLWLDGRKNQNGKEP